MGVMCTGCNKPQVIGSPSSGGLYLYHKFKTRSWSNRHKCNMNGKIFLYLYVSCFMITLLDLIYRKNTETGN